MTAEIVEGPEGLLKWGQSGIYNAPDDRAVIAAVTRYRQGLCWPPVFIPGSGLNILLKGGWLGVGRCGDGTSAVVNDVNDLWITCRPGPTTGSAPRRDVVWCYVRPDYATWQIRVTDEWRAEGWPGIRLATLTVPVGWPGSGTLLIEGVAAELERRLNAYSESWWRPPGGGDPVGAATRWQDADTVVWTQATVVEPWQWYRVSFYANSVMCSQGPNLQGRIGLGWHPQGTADTASQIARAAVISYPRIGGPASASVHHVFQHQSSAPSVRHWDGRIWHAGTGRYWVWTEAYQGAPLYLTVEDIGS
jgi:hypothetical protein